MKKIKVSSEIGVTLYMIGGKYKPIILNYLIENKTKNFGYYVISSKKARTIFKYYYEKYIIKYQLPTLTRKWSNEIYNYCVNYKNRYIINTKRSKCI